MIGTMAEVEDSNPKDPEAMTYIDGEGDSHYNTDGENDAESDEEMVDAIFDDPDNRTSWKFKLTADENKPGSLFSGGALAKGGLFEAKPLDGKPLDGSRGKQSLMDKEPLSMGVQSSV